MQPLGVFRGELRLASVQSINYGWKSDLPTYETVNLGLTAVIAAGAAGCMEVSLSEQKAHRAGKEIGGIVYVTRNTEYHVDARGVCLSVRARDGCPKMRPQSAIDKAITSVINPDSLLPRRGRAALGMRLCFGEGLSQVVTSPIVAIHSWLRGDPDGGE